MTSIERYGIYWVDLNPVIGAVPSFATRPVEKRTGSIAKIRPAIVVSDALMNQHLQTVVVCPLTSQLHPQWRTRLQVDCAGRPAEIAVDQIRTISRLRVGERIDQVDDAVAAQLRALLVEMYGTA
jgi:mRNA interferase MazF